MLGFGYADMGIVGLYTTIAYLTILFFALRITFLIIRKWWVIRRKNKKIKK